MIKSGSDFRKKNLKKFDVLLSLITLTRVADFTILFYEMQKRHVRSSAGHSSAM